MVSGMAATTAPIITPKGAWYSFAFHAHYWRIYRSHTQDADSPHACTLDADTAHASYMPPRSTDM